MLEYLFIVAYAVILLVILTIMSYTGMTIYDAIVFTNYTDTNEIINSEIVEHINNKTGVFLIRTKGGYSYKKTKVVYDVLTDTIMFGEEALPFSDTARLALYLLIPTVQK